MLWLRRGLILGLTFMLGGCLNNPTLKPLARPAQNQPYAVQSIAPLEGVAEWPAPAGRQVQTDIAEIANRATIALISATTGYTVGTAVTDINGRFAMQFMGGFVPADGLYYLEAYKGLKAGTDAPNRVNSDCARMRTFMRRAGGSWSSLTGNSVKITTTTTALCIILSLRSMDANVANQLTAAEQISLMGTIDPNPASATAPAAWNNPVSGKISTSFLTSTYLGVVAALLGESDPFKSLTVDINNPNVILIPPKPLTVAAYTPAAQLTGGLVNILGSGFSATASENVVEFTTVSGTPVAATVNAVSVDTASMSVTVPAGAVTGPLAVTVGGRKIVGPNFYLALQSGHESIDEFGNLYVANETFGSIAKITPQGAVSTFYTGLDAPRALTINNGTKKLYVTCAGAKKGVMVYNFANPGAGFVDYCAPGTLADPRGIAYDSSGLFYVSDAANQKIYRITGAGSTPVALTVTVTNGATLDGPHGLGFGADGKLYVANTNANNIITLAVSGGSATSDIFRVGFASPWGLAFDPLGNLYISNNKGNSIYRWDATLNTLSPYANMPYPGGLVADRGGYVYAIDNVSNNLYRITSVGDTAMFASGISQPSGLVKVGNYIYVLSKGNNSLMEINTTTTGVRTVARGFNQPQSIQYDGTRDCFYVTNVGTATMVRVASPSFAVTTVLTGLANWSSGNGGFGYRNGRVYLAWGNDIRSYDVTNWAAAPTVFRTISASYRGLTVDTTVASPGYQKVYIAANGTPSRVMRLAGEYGNGHNYHSRSSANHVEDFVNAYMDSDLNNPADVTVDTAGRVWITNQGSHKIVVYNADRTKASFSPIAGNNPYGINFDGTYVWVVNYANRAIVGYTPATGAVFKTLDFQATFASGDHPRNIAFYNSKIYVVCDEGIGTITGYTGVTPTYSRITTMGGGASDIDVGSDGSIYYTAGIIRRIVPDLSTQVDRLSNYNGPNWLWMFPDRSNMYYTDPIRFSSLNDGDWVWRMASGYQTAHTYKLAYIDANNNLYYNGVTQCGADTMSRIASSSTPGAYQKEWWASDWDSDCGTPVHGGMAADTLGNAYMSVYQGCDVWAFDTNGTLSPHRAGLSRAFTSFGMWADPAGTYLLQALDSHHRIDQITWPGGVRTTLPYGLSSAEM